MAVQGWSLYGKVGLLVGHSWASPNLGYVVRAAGRELMAPGLELNRASEAKALYIESLQREFGGEGATPL